MLHLAIIGIVCAVSAPIEGTAIIGRKNYGFDAFGHFDEGTRKEAKSFPPRVYNVDTHNSSAFDTQKITDRTNSFNCDYINKQYQSGRGRLCSVVENVFRRKKNEFFQSNVRSTFRKRGLLWSTNKFSPKTLRPPMDTEGECGNCTPCDWNNENCHCGKPKCPKAKSKKPCCKKKKKKYPLYSLKCCQKKDFLRLKKRRGKMYKRHLDKVKIDDELDLNKRIQKLVQEIAAENQRTALTGSTDECPGPDASSGERTSEKNHTSFRFFKKLKNFFWFNKNNSYNKKNNYYNPNSVPVNSVRGDVLVADKTARISNLKTPFLKRETRFRRNLYRNYVSYSQGDDSVSRYRKNMVRKPYPYSNNFKKKAKFLYPQYRQRHFGDIRKPHRLLYNPHARMKLRPHSKLILKPNVKDFRPKRQNDKLEQIVTKDDAATEDSNTVQNEENMEHKGAELTTMKSDHLKEPMNDSPSAEQENLERSNDEDDIPDHSLEKPFLDKRFRYCFAKEGGANADFKTFEDRYNLRTDFPLFDNSIARHPYQRYKYDKSKEEYLNPYRYLKIRHALRHYLIHNNVLTPMPPDSPVERKKRCGGGKCCPLPHKCWRSPPLLCIPYIRKGQDDLLRYLIRTMQRMIGRPFPPKIDIFDSTKFKPCGKMAGSTCDDVMYDDDDECDCVSTQPCMPVQTCPPAPPSTPSSCPCLMNPVSKVCPCSPQLVPIPKPYHKSPYAPNNRPCLPTQRSCPYENYNSPYGYLPAANAYPSSSPNPYPNDNIDPMLYSTQSYYGYNEPVPTPQSPCLPGNPYGRSALTSPSPPLRSPSGPLEAANYAPTPPYNPFPRASDKTPTTFTRAQYSPPSTANACSWYMSKSPVERAEYFAYTNLPYNGPPESVSVPIPWAQSEASKPGIIPPPYPSFNAQPNQPAPQRFNLQTGPAYLERPPMPMASGMNSQTNTERFMYENQYKERRKNFDEVKQSDDVNTGQMNQLRKEAHERADSDTGDNLNPPGTVRCEAQQHALNDNQMQKPEMSPEYSKNGNKESIHNTFKYADQQTAPDNQKMPKAEATNDYTKPLVKEQNPQIVQNSHPSLLAETNDEASKNQNSEDGYKCGNQHYPLNEQQIPKPEMNIKEVKNPSKGEVFRCPDRQCTSNDRQQLQKPEINENNDDRRFFKTKHYKGILKNFRKPATEFFHSYDDYYDKHPFMDPEELSSFRYGKSPFMKTWRGYSRKVKKNSKRGSSVRQKRGDNYYAWPDSFEDYNDYESDFDEPVVSDEAPSYEMFSELAKAVTALNSTASYNSTATNTSTPEGMKISPLISTPIKVDDVTGKKKSKDRAYVSFTTVNTIVSVVSRPVEYSNKKKATNTGVNITVAHTKPANATIALILNSTTPGLESNEKSNSDESIDSKMSGKPGFFQTNSKSLGIQSNSGFFTTTKVSNKGLAKEDKELEGSQDLESAEEGQVPTTLKTTSIVKGPKKLLTKPSPKVYTKVYPDSLPLDPEPNEAMVMATAAVTTTKTVLEKTTLAMGSTSDIQVQLLAVCEGYLEVVKLIKAQNQTLGEDLDANLARYCENIISQNFNLQSDSSKPKKHEGTQSPSEKNITAATTATIRNSTESGTTLREKDVKTPKKEASQHRNKITVNIPNTAKYKRGTFYNTQRDEGDFRAKKLKCPEYENINDEEVGVSDRMKKSQLRRKKSEKTKSVCLSTQSDPKSIPKKPKRYRRKEQSEEELLEKGITKEQVELLHLLRKRKRALLSWLYNSKEAPNKPNDAQETEYFDDEEELAQGSDLPSHSGTIALKEYEITSTTTESEGSFLNESVFPVYAREYGYDRGGELMEVEVLWRKINEKTHEKKIFKNLSVLALLLTSTNEPNFNAEGTRLIPRELESEEMSEIQSKSESKVGYADQVENCNKKTSTNPTVAKVNNSCKNNNTYMYISKPDPKCIVGAPPNVTVLHSNSSRKMSHKLNAAKDLFQEYTLEFLNYAVYILPIMFTVLFVFCCLCCAVQIFKTKNYNKKHKKKKKRQISTEDSETSDESQRESKKKRREARRKKHCAEGLDKKKSKTFWDVLKMHSAKPNAEFNDESQTEKRRSFLRFLKGRREQGKAGMCSSHYSPVREVEDDMQQGRDSEVHGMRERRDGNPRKYCQNEAEERRELIALLEELKKIETENTKEKKEVKSVHVQYMTQEDDSPVFQRPDFSFPYQKNVFGMPKGCSPCNKHFPFYQSDPATVRSYELFEDVNELTELLPCECNYYSKRNDYLRHCDFKIKQEGGCKSFIKIFRDAGVTRNKPFKEKNLFNNESENRSFIFNKYRSISTDTSDELLGVTQKSAGTEVRLTDNVVETASPFKLQSKKNADFLEEMDSLKRQLKNKKHVRLKDDGVLCRL